MKREDLEKSGNEFGNEKRKVMIVIRDLYDLNSSGSAWRDIIDERLIYLGYKLSREDMDFRMNTETNPQTIKEYYYYVLVYVDDFLHLNHDPKIFMKNLKGVYKLKDGSLGPPPDIYALMLKSCNYRTVS